MRSGDAGERVALSGKCRGTEYVSRQLSCVKTSVMTYVGKLQAGYYLSTGIWSVLHRSSFEGLTGRKQDYWLVRTVGLLAASIGLGLYAGSRAGSEVSGDMRVAAIASSVGFAGIDLVEVARRRISPVYLLDLAAQVALLAAWRRRTGPR